jgi:hypothetical protein
MIILDEQLLGANLEQSIGKWYQGNVCFITDLRPNSIIKDEAIPMLLRKEAQPTFITINERDFWRKVAISEYFCIVFFNLPDSRASEISLLLRNLFRHPEFNIKAKRMGKVIRIADSNVSYYSTGNREIQEFTLQIQ